MVPSRLPCIQRLALSGLSSSREFCVAVERAFECLSPPCLAFFRSSSVLRFNVHLNVSRFCGNAHRNWWQISILLKYVLPISHALFNICCHRCSVFLSFHLRVLHPMTRVLLHDASGMLCVGRGTGMFGGRPVWAMVRQLEATPSDSSSLSRTVPMCAKTFFERKKPNLVPMAPSLRISPTSCDWSCRQHDALDLVVAPGYSLVAFPMTQPRRVNVSPRSGRTNTNTHLVLNASERWSRLCGCGPRRLRCLFSSARCSLSRRLHSRPVVLSHTGRC